MQQEFMFKCDPRKQVGEGQNGNTEDGRGIANIIKLATASSNQLFDPTEYSEKPYETSQNPPEESRIKGNIYPWASIANLLSFGLWGFIFPVFLDPSLV